MWLVVAPPKPHPHCTAIFAGTNFIGLHIVGTGGEQETRAPGEASAARERTTVKHQTEADGGGREKDSVRGRDGAEERKIGSHFEGQRDHHTKGTYRTLYSVQLQKLMFSAG